MNDSHLFRIAREVSLSSDYVGCGKAKLGCVVVYKGTILAKGFNSNKTHTYQDVWNIKRFKNDNNKYLPSKIHAELNAIQRIKYLDIDFSRVHVYIYRELSNGQLAMARPCPSCLAAIKAMGIKHIHYTSDCGYVHEYLV